MADQSSATDKSPSAVGRWASRLGFAALLFVAFAIGGGFVRGLTKSTPQVSSTPVVATAEVEVSAPTVDKSPAMQAKRWSAIQELITAGVFQKTGVPGTSPRVWVRPAFYDLDFDQKQTFVSVVYAYYLDGSDESAIVRVFDSRTDKAVGSFSSYGGLDLN